MKPSKARILIVDDDPGLLRAVTRVLAPLYELTTASSPTEALAAARTFNPDLAILDIRMPAMDGFELMRRLKAEQPDLDVIFITGSMTEPDANLIRAIRQGAFYFVQKPFDREVLQTLVERCLELRRLRALADRELNKLRTAQSRLLPQSAPKHPKFDIAFRHRPFYFATGDYHDFFPQPNGSVAIFVGDSTGHGPSACMLMATMRTLLGTHPEVHGDPGAALSRLGNMFHALTPADLFMTAVYLVLGANGDVSWAAAGQHPPLRVSARGDVAVADLSVVGLPLGIEPDVTYETVSWPLAPGESLFLFTDGIIEATNSEGKFFGLRGVRNCLASLSETSLDTESILEGLIEKVKNHLDGSEFGDDFTLLAVKRRA